VPAAATVHPLDLERTSYAYIERPNAVILDVLAAHVLAARPHARILDVGCGCGANAAEVRRRFPGAYVVGIEPNARAAELASARCHEVHCGDLASWLDRAPADPFDAIVLSDVLEHVADPLAFLRSLQDRPPLRGATWVISVPNYAVWYNRARTLVGRFEYAWSGLFDRTHLRFFTRASIRRLLAYAGFEVIADACTPSLVQSTAPLLRALFAKDVAAGDHLALVDSPAFRAYTRLVEPLETKLCQRWPELLGFQVVTVARSFATK
jgi:2-polyprenyl-3-methyl-5-hydroxy-6-metoxy-1,4-benzoquinol methylase